MADLDTETRRRLAAQGRAMRGGRFPIRNRADLENAIRAVGRVRPNTEPHARRYAGSSSAAPASSA